MKKVRSSDLAKYVRQIYSENMYEENDLSEYTDNVVVNANSFCISILDFNIFSTNYKLVENFKNEIEELSLKNLKIAFTRIVPIEDSEVLEIYLSISNEYEIVMD